MEEGLTRSADDSENLNTEIDKLFHDLTRKEETHAVRIRTLEAELDKKREEMDVVAASLQARESQFKERERRLKELADKDSRETAAFYDRMLKDFGDKEKNLLFDINELKKELIVKTGDNEKLKNEVQELKSRLSQALELCAEERNKGAERDIFAQSARSALKGKEEEIAKIWHILEDTKAELSREKAGTAAADAEIGHLREAKQNLQLEVNRLSGDMARGEQGFYDKAELLKKELKEKERRSYELELKLVAAEKKLNETLDEATAWEKLLYALRQEHEETLAVLKESQGKTRELEAELQVIISKAHTGGAEQKLGRLLEARDEINKNLTQKIKSMEEALSAVRGEYAVLLEAAQQEKNGVSFELKRRDEETAAAQGRQRALEKELADTAEKWRRAETQLNEAEANLREKDNAIEILNSRLASLEHERENYTKISKQARSAAAEFSALAEKSGNEQAAKLFAALKDEAARYEELLKKYEDLSLKLEFLGGEKAQALAEAARLAKENAVLREKNENKLKAAEESFKAELARSIEAEKGRYEALSLEIRRVAVLLKQKESELEQTRDELNPLKAEYEALLESNRRLREKYSEELRAENAAFKEAKRDVSKREDIISRLAKSVAETRRETEKIKSEKESLAALLRNRKTGQDRELRNALKEAEKILKDKEHKLQDMTGALEKTKKEKAELIEKERGLKESLSSKPYRALLKDAQERLRLKEGTIRGLQSRMERVTADFSALKRRDSQLSARSTGPGGDLVELLSGISHQVSNSISIIRSHAEFCLETPDAANIKESLNVIMRNIVALQKKIEDILGFSKPVRLQLAETGLKTAALDALNNVKKEKGMSGIKTDFMEEAGLKPLKVDRVRLTAALEQVFSNAFEAMPGGGAIRVSVRMSGDGGAQTLEITDTGEGIEPKNLAMVFHPFFTTRPGKLGLGLALAKNVIKAHGGTINISSEVKKGAVVAIAIPETGSQKQEVRGQK